MLSNAVISLDLPLNLHDSRHLVWHALIPDGPRHLVRHANLLCVGPVSFPTMLSFTTDHIRSQVQFYTTDDIGPIFST